MTTSPTPGAVRLEPCPFCGDTPTLDDYTDKPAASWVLVHRSKKCPVAPAILNFPTSERAQTAWNTRAATPVAPAGDDGEGLIRRMMAAWPDDHVMGAPLAVDISRFLAARFLAARAQPPGGEALMAALQKAHDLPRGKRWFPELAEDRKAIRRLQNSPELLGVIAAALAAGGEK